ncbi:M23 family metallopeptidase [Flavobacterium urocaniciphilum]|uniref:Murein DD-endopeptidase MepM and murein hydrolase activator NlpD, contain LysM domain n=1 Tax=Flavobacterium urocaniciphilum TaxID=1299341 RepID=A0A1H9BKM4_9FLAO|nr:peptidoglycan DD-metalloendopeptidase family protein [Flavobacterium urocaniciphilum]SEP89512.1 Murein DD-endopeptidase MepM and murein hydrolase activator NlpD, contain LysM domain [Flavobacterium urocaniciphilum]
MKYILYLLILVLGFSCQQEKSEKVAKIAVKKEPIVKEYGFIFNDFTVVQDTLESGDTFSTILEGYTLPDSLKLFDITEKVKDSFNIKNIRAGKEFITFSDKKNKKNLKAFVYVQDKTSYLVVDLRDSIKVEIKKRPTILKRRTIAAELDGSLSETLSRNGVSAALANELAQIYKYSIDFFKLKKGDKFAVTIQEKYFENGEYLGVDKVEASYFEYKGKKIYAFPYKLNENQKRVEYYDEKASGAKSMFLKAPLDYFKLTSKFTARRFHPVQFKWKAHNGTDYAAPHGTPIKTTASGVVEATGYTSGNGNFVKVKHNSKYSTQYLHMSKILVRRGQSVTQGQIIGKVGSTGLATGPHVCYRFWKNGVQVDPLRMKLPSSEPMTKKQKEKYLATIAPLKKELDDTTAKTFKE